MRKLGRYKVLAFDTDDQLNLSTWYDKDESKFDLIELNIDSIYTLKKDLKDHKYDFVVLDGSANNLHLASAAIMISDMVII